MGTKEKELLLALLAGLLGVAILAALVAGLYFAILKGYSHARLEAARVDAQVQVIRGPQCTR